MITDALTIYSDIIFLEKPVSHHRPMDISHRAKQFAPFDALKGMDESIKNAEVLHCKSYETVYEPLYLSVCETSFDFGC